MTLRQGQYIGAPKRGNELICSVQVDPEHGWIEDSASLKSSQILTLKDSAWGKKEWDRRAQGNFCQRAIAGLSYRAVKSSRLRLALLSSKMSNRWKKETVFLSCCWCFCWNCKGFRKCWYRRFAIGYSCWRLLSQVMKSNKGIACCCPEPHCRHLAGRQLKSVQRLFFYDTPNKPEHLQPGNKGIKYWSRYGEIVREARLYLLSNCQSAICYPFIFPRTTDARSVQTSAHVLQTTVPNGLLPQVCQQRQTRSSLLNHLIW